MVSDARSAIDYDLVEIEGRPFKMARIDGPAGTFQPAFAGAESDGFSFLYRDKKHTFFFKTAEGDLSTKVEVVSATIGKISRRVFKTSLVEGAVIERNIEAFFKSRSIALPWKAITADEAPQTILFTWRVVE